MNLRRALYGLSALAFVGCGDDAPEAVGCQSDSQCSLDGSQMCIAGTCQGATSSSSSTSTSSESAESETTQGTGSGTTSSSFSTTGATATTGSAEVTTSVEGDTSTSGPADDTGTTTTTTSAGADETAGCENPLTAEGVVEMSVPLMGSGQGQRFNLLHMGTIANPGLPLDLDGAQLIVRAYAPHATNAQLRVFFRSSNTIDSRAFIIPLEDFAASFVDVAVPVPAAAGGFDPTDIDVIRFEVESVPGSRGPWQSPATIVYLDSLMSDNGEVNHPFYTDPFCQVFCDSGSRPLAGSQRSYHEIFVDESNCLPPESESSTGEPGESTGAPGESTSGAASTGESEGSTSSGGASSGDPDASTGSVASETGG